MKGRAAGCPRPGSGSLLTTMTLSGGGGQSALQRGLMFGVKVLEFQRRVITEAAMKTSHVVPALQEREQTPPCLFMGGEVFTREQLCFERAEERLAHRVDAPMSSEGFRVR